MDIENKIFGQDCNRERPQLKQRFIVSTELTVVTIMMMMMMIIEIIIIIKLLLFQETET
jgi:hypothetical protein